MNKFILNGATMERISIEKSDVNLLDIVRRVESGEELMLTLSGRDVAHVISPTKSTKNKKDFFELLNSIKSNSDVNATVDEIKDWIEEGRA